MINIKHIIIGLGIIIAIIVIMTIYKDYEKKNYMSIIIKLIILISLAMIYHFRQIIVKDIEKEIISNLPTSVKAIFTYIAFMNKEINNMKTDIKNDVAIVKKDYANIKGDIKTDIATIKTNIKSDITTIKGDVKTDIATINFDLNDENVRVENSIWTFSFKKLKEWLTPSQKEEWPTMNKGTLSLNLLQKT